MGNLMRQLFHTQVKIGLIEILGVIGALSLLAIGFAIGYLAYFSFH